MQSTGYTTAVLNKPGARMQNEGLGRDTIAIFIMIIPIILPEPISGGERFFSFLFLVCFSGGRARRHLWSEIK